jgi:hypothetical protein
MIIMNQLSFQIILFSLIGIAQINLAEKIYPNPAKTTKAYPYFVGLTSHKVFFALIGNDWLLSSDYCMINGFSLAKIETQEENEVVTEFLNTTQLISPEYRVLWLAATDYNSEGSFKWLPESVALGYANWDTGMPSMNRSRNCAVIKSNGKWADEECQIWRYALCQRELLSFKAPIVDRKVTNAADDGNMFSDANSLLTNPRLEFVGIVGNKTYMVDATMESNKYLASLDFCHQHGMRLAAIESTEEETFLMDYSNRTKKLLTTSVTNTMTHKCGQKFTHYHVFATGKVSSYEFPSGLNWSKCVIVTPSAVTGGPDCIGWAGLTTCEFTSS